VGKVMHEYIQTRITLAPNNNMRVNIVNVGLGVPVGPTGWIPINRLALHGFELMTVFVDKDNQDMYIGIFKRESEG
jgi:hypothetical protein